MSAIKMYSNDSLGIVMWDHRPGERFAPHGNICYILRAAIKSRFSVDMLSLRMWYSVNIYLTYRLLYTCIFFQMLMQINRSNWGHLQNEALCPMLLYTTIGGLSSKFEVFLAGRSQFDSDHGADFSAPTCCQSATFVRPLFGVFCRLFFLRINI